MRRTAVLTLVPAALLLLAGGPAAAAAPGHHGGPAGAAQPPTVTLTSPRPGVDYDAPATIDLRAIASAPAGAVTAVEFYQDKVLVGTDPTAPYSLRLTGVGDGTYTFFAVAYDDAGRSATSADATVTVATPPTVTLRGVVEPGVETGCLVLSAGGVVYELYGGDPAVVRVGALVEVTGRLPRYAVSACQQGRVLRITEARALPPASEPPAVRLASPADGEVFPFPGELRLGVSADDPDGTVVRVDYFAGDLLLATVTQPPFARLYTFPVAGRHAIRALAYDDTGMTAWSVPVSIEVVR